MSSLSFLSSAAFFFLIFFLSLSSILLFVFLSSGFSSTGWISSFTLLGLFIVFALLLIFMFWFVVLCSVVTFFYADFYGFRGVCWLLFDGDINFDDFNYYFFGVACFASLALFWLSTFFYSAAGLATLTGADSWPLEAPQPIVNI